MFLFKNATLQAFVVVFFWCFASTLQSCMWFVFSTVTPEIIMSVIPKLTLYQLRLFLVWGSVPPIIGGIPAMFVVERYGYAFAYYTTCLLCFPMVLTCAGLAFSESFRESTFAVVMMHVSSLLNGLAASFVTGACASVAAAWFHPKHRGAVISAVVTLNNAGNLVLYLAALILVDAHHPSTLSGLFHVMWIMGTVVLVGLLFLPPDRNPRGYSPVHHIITAANGELRASVAVIDGAHVSHAGASDALHNRRVSSGDSLLDGAHAAYGTGRPSPRVIVSGGACSPSRAIRSTGAVIPTPDDALLPGIRVHHPASEVSLLSAAAEVLYMLKCAVTDMPTLLILIAGCASGGGLGSWSASATVIFTGGEGGRHCAFSNPQAEQLGLFGLIFGIAAGGLIGWAMVVFNNSYKFMYVTTMSVGLFLSFLVVLLVDRPPCPVWLGDLCTTLPPCTFWLMMVLQVGLGIISGISGPLCVEMAVETVYPDSEAVASEVYTSFYNAIATLYLFIPPGDGYLSLNLRCFLSMLIGFVCAALAPMLYRRREAAERATDEQLLRL